MSALKAYIHVVNLHTRKVSLLVDFCPDFEDRRTLD
jgi:hypothetical protein